MTSLTALPFRTVWLVDFEFAAPPGERPTVVCLVAKEILTGRTLRLWQDQLNALPEPPYELGSDSLFVAYYASAELGCHLALDWPLPANVLDLYAEFRNHTNGLPTVCGAGLLGALAYFGLPAVEAHEKASMRALAQRGGPWTTAEQQALLDYCASDVDALARLLPAMASSLDLPRALLRGAYMKAAAHMEHAGVPIDWDTLHRLRQQWDDLKDHLIQRIDAAYGVYDGHTFKRDCFAAWLQAHNIPWPRRPSGALDLSDDTFRDMARGYPIVAPLRELRVALSQLRLADLAVGSDGRNRCLLSAFRSRTGRNQPSNAAFIFGPSVWLRSLIRPPAGWGLAYIDWSQQEFGIAAALSQDPLMMAAYASGDPYLEFARQAGAVPQDATKQTHPAEREQFKACVLAVQYGMGAEALAQRIDQPVARARELLRLHRETYRVFWRWLDGAVSYAMLHGALWTTFGWTVHTGADPNPRFLANFLMQANGAEMLRRACIMATGRGIQVCAPVHDAILIAAPLDQIDEQVRATQTLMAAASRDVLENFELRSDAAIVRYPDRYTDPRGITMWETVQTLLREIEETAATSGRNDEKEAMAT